MFSKQFSLKVSQLAGLPIAAMAIGVAISGCNPQPPTPTVTQKFSPLSGAILTSDPATITVTNLDAEPVVCYTIDGTTPVWNNGSCSPQLALGDRTIELDCGYNQVTLMWASGAQTSKANYTVAADRCLPAEVTLWSNDELVQSFTQWKDEIQCKMNNCQIPTDPSGSWTANCDNGGTVSWVVSRPCGTTACIRNTFTYNNCSQVTTITVHDYDADPAFHNSFATKEQGINLIVNGTIIQDLDGFGDGAESGTVAITGDFTGSAQSNISIYNKRPNGGYWSVGCESDPISQEVCAPSAQLVSFDYPLWTCRGEICPEPSDTDTDKDGIVDRLDNCPELANADQADADEDNVGDVCDDYTDHDTDGDGVFDLVDNCPAVANATQSDLDADGLGDACDTPSFYMMKMKAGGRCLYDSGSDVVSTSDCSVAENNQRWQLLTAKPYVFKNVSTGKCIVGAWDGSMSMTTCNTGAAYQQWVSQAYGSDSKFPLRLKNNNANFCIYTDGTSLVYGTLGNCGLAGTESNRQIGIYPWGDFNATPVQP